MLCICLVIWREWSRFFFLLVVFYFKTLDFFFFFNTTWQNSTLKSDLICYYLIWLIILSVFWIGDCISVSFDHFPFVSSSGSSWLPPVKSSRVLKRVGVQLKNCGRWWCRSAAYPASTSGPAMVESASSNREIPHSASCPGETRIQQGLVKYVLC